MTAMEFRPDDTEDTIWKVVVNLIRDTCGHTIELRSWNATWSETAEISSRITQEATDFSATSIPIER